MQTKEFNQLKSQVSIAKSNKEKNDLINKYFEDFDELQKSQIFSLLDIKISQKAISEKISLNKTKYLPDFSNKRSRSISRANKNKFLFQSDFENLNLEIQKKQISENFENRNNLLHFVSFTKHNAKYCENKAIKNGVSFNVFLFGYIQKYKSTQTKFCKFNKLEDKTNYKAIESYLINILKD